MKDLNQEGKDIRFLSHTRPWDSIPEPMIRAPSKSKRLRKSCETYWAGISQYLKTIQELPWLRFMSSSVVTSSSAAILSSESLQRRWTHWISVELVFFAKVINTLLTPSFDQQTPNHVNLRVWMTATSPLFTPYKYFTGFTIHAPII